MATELDEVPGFLCIDHVAIAVVAGELDRQVEAYKRIGFTVLQREDVGGNDLVREVLLQVGNGPNRMQLLEPLSEASPVAKQLQRNGGRSCVAHIAFRVADIHLAFAHLKRAGFHMVDAAPRAGSHGTMVFFVHPKTTDDSAFGYLLEVVERRST